MLRFLAGSLIAAALSLVPAHGAIPAGAAQLLIGDEEPLEVFTYRPASYRGGPLILVFHGIGRNAEEYRNFAITLAERYGVIVAAPHFDRARFPGENYHQGGVLSDGEVRPVEEWTFSRLPPLIAELQVLAGDADLPYYILGHSAGGQFVARLAAMVGPLGAERLIAANPGSHLFPTRDFPYGYGFGGLPDELGSDEAIRRFLAAPLTVYLGTADNNPNHSSLDRSPTAMLQGSFRYVRGLNCFAAAEALAAERGWDFNWRKVEVEGVAHDAARMFAAAEAEEALFGVSGSPNAVSSLAPSEVEISASGSLNPAHDELALSSGPTDGGRAERSVAAAGADLR
jgi:poly(3-hydroxybutyrate) depolymerase